MDMVKEFSELKARSADLQSRKSQAQGTLKSLVAQKKSIEEEMAALGLSPENADTVVAEMEAKLEKLISEAGELLDSAEEILTEAGA